MAHFVETMMYVGELPWHKLGTYAGQEDVTGAEALKLAQIDWKVRKAPAYALLGHDSVSGQPIFKAIADQFSIVRSREGEPIEAHEPLPNVTVGRVYTPLQNSQLSELCDALRTAAGGEVRVHTAGSLMEGRKVWILAQHAGAIVVQRRGGREDISAPFLLLHNSHDGEAHTVIQHTPVRVVCWNTLSAALEGHSGARRIRHTACAGAKLREATQALGYAIDYFTAYGELANELAATPMNREEYLRTLVTPLLTGKDDPAEAAEVASKVMAPENKGRAQTNHLNKVNELLAYFSAGKGNHGEDRFDALNAVTEFIDSQRGRIGRYKAAEARLMESRFVSAQFGQGAETKARALRLLSR